MIEDPDTGLLLLPRANKRLDVAMPSSMMVRETLLILDRDLTTKWVDVVVELLPRPDNSYNPKAVSVAQPRWFGGSSDRRHVGWVYDRDHPAIGGENLHVIARQSEAGVGCHARFRMNDGHVEGQLLVAGRSDIEAALRKVRATGMGRSGPVHRARAVPDPTADEAAIRDVASWRRRADAPASVRIKSAFRHRKIWILNSAGGRVGEVVDGVAFLHDESHRPAALAAAADLNVAVRPQLAAGDSLPIWLERVRERDAPPTDVRTWAIFEPSGRRIGRFDPSNGTLYVHSHHYSSACTELVQRVGYSPATTEWERPGVDDSLTVLEARRDPTGPQPKAEGGVLVDERMTRHWRIFKRHRAMLPPSLPDDVVPVHFADDIPQALLVGHWTARLTQEVSYRRDLEAVFGPDVRVGPLPWTPCRLCGLPALVAQGQRQKKSCAYCPMCLSRVTRGVVGDRGVDEIWEPAALWALKELAGQLGAVPSEAQIPRIPEGLTPSEMDRAIVVRALVPRMSTARWLVLPEGVREQRKPYEWIDWLSKAGLVEGVPGPLGTASKANDGHHCRSLLERHIDDFLSAHEIPHVVEPNWPHDLTLNPHGMRADWKLPGNVFVEAWGMETVPAYAAKMERKQRLATKYGIRLIGVRSSDLGRLDTVFEDFLGR